MILLSLSKRERYLFYVVALVILSSLFYNFLLEPAAKTWKKLDRKILTKRVKLKRNLRMLTREKSIRAKYARYASYAKTEDSDEEEIAGILSQIEKLASNSSVHITNIKPQPIKSRGFYKKYSVEIESEVRIEELTKFIYDLESSSHLLKVERLQLNAKGGSSALLKSYMLITKIIVL